MFYMKTLTEENRQEKCIQRYSNHAIPPLQGPSPYIAADAISILFFLAYAFSVRICSIKILGHLA